MPKLPAQNHQSELTVEIYTKEKNAYLCSDPTSMLPTTPEQLRNEYAKATYTVQQ